MPTDDIALLNQLRRDGEITEEQYEALRRHVLWGTPLPAHLEAEFGDSGPIVQPAAEPQAGPVVEPEADAELPESLDLPQHPDPPQRQRPPVPPQSRKFTPTLPSARPDPTASTAQQGPPTPTFSPQLRPRPPQTGPRTGQVPQQNQHPYGQPNRPSAQSQPSQHGQSIRPSGPPPQRPPTQTQPSTQMRPASQARPQVQQRPQVPYDSPTGPRPPAPAPAPRGSSLKLPLLAGGSTVVVLLAALGVWFFGFRGDGSLSAAKYASAVCPDLASWQGDIAKSAGAMTAAVNGASDPRGKQKAAQSYFHAAGTRTDQLVTALGGDGTPKAGKAYAEELRSAARTAAGSFKSSAQQTGELETSASSFSSGLQVIIHDPQQPVSQLQATLAKAPDDLASAFKNDSACGSLRQPAP